MPAHPLLGALLPQVPFAAALVLGAVLASTDPVAVSALARRLGVFRCGCGKLGLLERSGQDSAILGRI